MCRPSPAPPWSDSTPEVADHDDEAAPLERERPRVVLGVSGGIAAYKACELLRRLTESGHDVTVVPTESALEFVGAPTWAALSGQARGRERLEPGARGSARAAGPAGRPRAGRARHRRPAGQGRSRPGRRPADQHPAHREVPGGARPGHAHRDVGAPGDPGQRGHAARPRRPGARARRGPAHRQGHRQGPAARPRGDLRGRPAGAGPARRRGRPRRSPRRGLGRRDQGVPRPGPVPRQPILRPAGLRPGPGRSRPGRLGDAGQRERRPARARPAPTSSGWRRPRSSAPRWSRPPRARTPS